MSERDLRERDILVAPGEYAYVQDLTKGDIVLYVGPTKISLSNTERMICYRDHRFVPVSSEESGQGVHPFIRASSSQYIILENPPAASSSTPVKGANSAIALEMGRKIVVPGPARFPLWPGQSAQVVDGHELRQDEYLIARVYEKTEKVDAEIGSELIVRGTEVSFYVPETGLEVVPTGGRYVRDALRLDKTQGLHLRVVSGFESDGAGLIPTGPYRAGQELFIRDQEGYYVPLPTMELIGLVTRTPLADNEAIYVRAHDTGAISTIQGPANYLPDPTKESVVRRKLSDRLKTLYRTESSSGERAIAIEIPPSTAVMVVGPHERDVVTGPATRILGYHENLEELALSTGRPKSEDALLATCFLQVDGNKVSDKITVRTRDHVELEVSVSYRVSFVGNRERWFAVQNYVGLLCDHVGSIVRGAARSTDINEFHTHSTELIRTAILGPRNESGKRDGRLFEENGMWVYDTEVLDVRILDDDVEALLAEAQHAAIVSDIARLQEELRLGDEKMREQVNQEVYAVQMKTYQAAAELEAVRKHKQLAEAATITEVEMAKTSARAEARARAHSIASEAQIASDERRAALEGKRLEAQAAAFVHQMTALQPELIATLKTLGNQRLAGELSQNLAPLAILGGESVADVAERLIGRLPLGPDSMRSIASLLPGRDEEESTE